jgi:acetylornithine/succinyldiaminopimelate/putrescine aminotransferase
LIIGGGFIQTDLGKDHRYDGKQANNQLVCQHGSTFGGNPLACAADKRGRRILQDFINENA